MLIVINVMSVGEDYASNELESSSQKRSPGVEQRSDDWMINTMIVAMNMRRSRLSLRPNLLAL